jgi:hypothetical protein
VQILKYFLSPDGEKEEEEGEEEEERLLDQVLTTSPLVKTRTE